MAVSTFGSFLFANTASAAEEDKSEKDKPVESETPGSPDSLQDSFQKMKKFAKQAEQPLEPEVDSALTEAAKEMMALGERSQVPLTDITEQSARTALSDLKHMALTDQPNVSLGMQDTRVVRVIIGKDAKALNDQLVNIVQGLFVPGDERDIQILINANPLPIVTIGYVATDTYQVDKRFQISISTGALAAIQNKDELVALIAQALGTKNPQSRTFHDDPRLYRRLNDQTGFESLDSMAKAAIRADISALERLRSVNVRPWALTDYELRIFTYFREKFNSTFAHITLAFPHYLLSEKKKSPQFKAQHDKYFELRILAQKVVVSYMQERENIKDLVQTTRELDGPLLAVHQRAKRSVAPMFSVLAQLKVAGKFVSAGAVGVYLTWATLSGALWAVAKGGAQGFDSYLVQNGWDQNALYQYTKWLATQTADGVQALHTDVWQPFVSSLSHLGNKTMEGVAAGWNGLVYGAQTVWDVIAAGGSAVGSTIGAAASYLGGKIVQGLTYGWVHLSAAMEQVWGGSSVVFRHIGYGVADVWSYLEPVIMSPFLWLGLGVTAVVMMARKIKNPPAVGSWIGRRLRPIGRGLSRFGQGTANFAKGQVQYAKTYMRETFKSTKDVNRLFGRLSGEGATYEELLRLASDLNVLDEDIYRWQDYSIFDYKTPTANGQKGFQRHPTAYLGSASLKRKAYWKLYSQFLEVFSDEMAKGTLNLEQVTTILRTMDGETERDFYSDLNKSSQLKFTGRTPLKTRLLENEDTRSWLATMYRVVTKRFALSSPPLVVNGSHVTLVLESLAPSGFEKIQLMGLANIIAQFETLQSTFDGALLVRLVFFVFHSLNMRWLAIQMLTKHWDALMASVFSEEFSPELRQAALYLFTQLKRDAPSDRINYEKKDRKDFWPKLPVMMSRYQSQRMSEGDFARAIAIESQVNANKYWNEGIFRTVQRTMSGHAILAGRIEAHLTNILQAARTLKDVTDAYDTFMRAGATSSGLTQRLFEFLVNRPEMLNTPEDIELVLDREYFWPQLNNNKARWKFILSRRPHIFSNRGIDPVEEPIQRAIETKMKRHPRSWQYEPVQAERMHGMLIQRLKDLNRFPSNYAGLKRLWIQLSQRGVTAETDRLFQALVELAPHSDLEEIQRLAIEEGRIWETDLHSKMAIAAIKSSPEYLDLLASQDPSARLALLKSVILELKAKMPELGIPYLQFLEDLSVQIVSSHKEAKMISEAKTDAARSNRQDSSFGNLNEVFEKLKEWPKKDQFNFLLVLRGDGEADPLVAHHFRNVGIERVRRMYEILPVAARVGVLDTFFTHSLVGTGGQESSRWIHRLTSHIIGGAHSESQKISYQLLSAFLHAVDEVGNGNLTTTILSYLYALPATATMSPGQTLKHVLEVFGATGIKVGQFLLAAQILPEEESKVLRSLQDRAKIPARMEIYEDVMDVLGINEGTELPFTVLDLLGAASMKYAFLAEDNETYQKLVVKIFRLEAQNNVDMQFDVLESMSRFLVRKYGPKYGVLDVIIESARRAVDRERNAQHEIYKSYIARTSIYFRLNEQGIEVQAPREDLVKDRMIVAQYAEGVSFNEIPDRFKPIVARKILTMEADILFKDDGIIRFDPDRHAGNYLILVQEDEMGGASIKISPIDFGQVLRISPEQRERVIRMFALAQIASKAGMNEWLLNQIQTVMSLNAEQANRLRKNAKRYIKAANFNPVTAYISMLAAVKASGFEQLDISYIDLIRGVIQLTQYEAYADQDLVTPSDIFEQKVLAYVEEYLGQIQLDDSQVRAIRVVNTYRQFKGFMTGKPQELIPEDLSKIDFSKFIRRDEGSSQPCEVLLKKGA